MAHLPKLRHLLVFELPAGILSASAQDRHSYPWDPMSDLPGP